MPNLIDNIGLIVNLFFIEDQNRNRISYSGIVQKVEQIETIEVALLDCSSNQAISIASIIHGNILLPKYAVYVYKAEETQYITTFSTYKAAIDYFDRLSAELTFS
jgi:hypothetical protein